MNILYDMMRVLLNSMYDVGVSSTSVSILGTLSPGRYLPSIEIA